MKLKLREAMKNAKNYFFGALLWIRSSIDDAIQHCNVIYSWRIVNHHGELQPSMKEDMIMSGALSTQVPNCMLPLQYLSKNLFLEQTTDGSRSCFFLPLCAATFLLDVLHSAARTHISYTLGKKTPSCGSISDMVLGSAKGDAMWP